MAWRGILVVGCGSLVCRNQGKDGNKKKVAIMGKY